MTADIALLAALPALGASLGNGTYADVCAVQGAPHLVAKRSYAHIYEQPETLREIAVMARLGDAQHPNVLPCAAAVFVTDAFSAADVGDESDADGSVHVARTVMLCPRASSDLVTAVESPHKLLLPPPTKRQRHNNNDDGGAATAAQLDAVDIGRQLLRGLAHAHANCVLHGDVKPANVLIFHDDNDADSRRPRAVLSDFGLATLCSEWIGGCTSIAYSGPYCAPEVEIAAGRSYGLAADVWALGHVLLFVLSNGALPNSADASVWRAYTRSRPHWLRDALANVPRAADWQRVLSKMMHAEPCLRPPAAVLLADPLFTTATAAAVDGSSAAATTASLLLPPFASNSNNRRAVAVIEPLRNVHERAQLVCALAEMDAVAQRVADALHALSTARRHALGQLVAQHAEDYVVRTYAACGLGVACSNSTLHTHLAAALLLAVLVVAEGEHLDGASSPRDWANVYGHGVDGGDVHAGVLAIARALRFDLLPVVRVRAADTLLLQQQQQQQPMASVQIGGAEVDVPLAVVECN